MELIVSGTEPFTIDILAEKSTINEEELILANEVCEAILSEPVENDHSSDEYEPEEKKIKESDYVPLDYKIKAVNIAKKHPKWTLATLRKRGCSRLKRKEYLAKWEEDIKRGGNTFDKYATIDSWTYDRFVEARRNYQQVTTKDLQQWALSAASQFQDLEFKASERWVKKFKKRHGIRQRKITKCVSENETATIAEMLTSAEIFRMEILQLIPKFDKKFVINMDQTGCQNKVAHSCTAQYALTLSGQLLPQVFVCLQEPTGRFGPRIQKSVDEYTQKYSNVTIKCSQSGKLTTELYVDFLQDCLKPHVGKENFLLLVDSWGGQTNPEIYDEIFQDDNNLPTCTVKVISPKCTPFVQPCEVYFSRQIWDASSPLEEHFVMKRIEQLARLRQRT